MDCRFLTSTGYFAWFIFSICASAQSIDFVSANLSVSLGSMSILLNTLVFLPFQIYHNIHANWWSSMFRRTLQKRWSVFVKRKLVEKLIRFDGIFESAQTWSAGGHSKIKKHMIYWLLWISASITRYVPLYPSRFQVFLNNYAPWNYLP